MRAGHEVGADVIVVGLGAHGSATLRALARAGVRAVGIDRFSPPHAHGSSHGETRITRLGVGEGADYVPLVRRSHELWRALEAETGLELLLPCGGLVLAPRGGAAGHRGCADFLGSTIAVAAACGVAHEVIEADEIGRRFPQFGLRGDEVGYYEPGAGLVYPERCIAAQLASARAHGALVRTGETVLALDQRGSCVRVVTDGATYAADRAVVAAGAWIPGLVGGGFAAHLQVHRQTLCWFAAEDPAAYDPARFPVFIWTWGDRAEDAFYGFPLCGAGARGLKVGVEQFTATVDPAARAAAGDDPVAPAERAALYERQVSGRLRGVGPRCVASASCLYTASPDGGFVVDAHPEHDRIAVVSACSGHGFKHSAGLGEAVAATVSGRDADLAAFALGSRFARRPRD